MCKIMEEITIINKADISNRKMKVPVWVEWEQQENPIKIAIRDCISIMRRLSLRASKITIILIINCNNTIAKT